MSYLLWYNTWNKQCKTSKLEFDGHFLHAKL